MAEHSKLSPSASHRWLNCPGSIRLSEGIERTTSPAAEEGIAAHFVGEHCLATRTKDPNRFHPDVFIRYKEWVNQDMFDYLQIYLDTIYADLSPTLDFEIERSLDLSWIHPDIKGTSDAFIGECMGVLKIYDLKYGRGVIVEPEENTQQKLYALGLIGEENAEAYQEVEIIIVQPRVPHPAGPVSRWSISILDLMQWAEQVRKSAKETENPNASLNAGPHCQFCPAAFKCPEMILTAAESVKIDFTVNESLESILTDIKIPDPSTFTPSEVSKALKFLKLLASWKTTFEMHAKSLMESGVEIPDFKLVASQGNRKWLDEEIVIKYLRRKYGNSFKIFNIAPLKSVAQVEKLFAFKEDKIDLSEFWEKPNTGNRIVSIEDKRKSELPSVEKDFDEIEDLLS